MSKIKDSLISKFISGFVSLTTAMWLSGFIYLMPVSVAKAATVEELQTQIQALLTQITQLQAQLTTVQGAPAAGKCAFTRSLTIGSKGDDVTCLQNYLTSTGHFTHAGGATGFFGSITKSAVAAWQAASGVSPAAGYFGSISQAKYNAIVVATPTPTPAPTPAPTPTPTGTGLAIEAGSQPANSLAVQSAARLPFTVLKLTAGSSDVTVKSITIERTGLAQDAVFAGIVLIDEDGTQITGLAKTLNSVHQVVLNDAFKVKAGTSKTVTVSGNMAAALTNYAGQVAYLSVVAVDAGSATVTATLPITGAGHTINASLSVGTATLTRGTLDPNTSVTKAVGSTGYTFSSIKITAGSAEDLLLTNARFNQSGSVATGDLANVKIYVDSTAYDATASSDGKYYSANFGAGITIGKGLQKDVLIKGDIVSGSGRTTDFDLWQYTDIVAKGKTYGYNITPSATETTADNDDDSEFQNSNPRYDASQVSVGAGALVVSNSTSVAASKIANGGIGIPLGSFLFDVTGETISFTQWVLTVATTGSGSDEGITNVSVYNANGAVIAGPQDPNSAGTSVTFSETVTLPVGKNVLTVKGNLDNDWETNDTIIVRFTPSSALTNVLGQVTGQSITPTPSSLTSANTQTVAAGALTANPAPSFANKNIVAAGGTTGSTLGEFVLDTTASGEDVRITSFVVRGITGTNADLDDLNTIQLFDGATALNTGSNAVNPSGNALAADANLTITLDAGGLIVSKGATKTLTLKGNVVSTSTPTSNTTYVFDFSAGSPDWGVTGVTTGQSISESLGTGSGATITLVSAGTLAITEDSTTPQYAIASPGTGKVIGIYRFTSTNEDIRVNQVGLQLSGTASNAPADLTNVSLWDGGTKLTDVVFTSDNATATIPTTANFTIPRDSYKLLTVKGDVRSITDNNNASTQGALIQIDYDGDAADSSGDATRGTGVESGTAVYSTGSDTTVDGVRVFRSYPTVAKLSVPSMTLVAGTMDLYRFSIAANPSSGNGIGLYQMTINMATSSGSAVSGTTTVTNLEVYAYTDSGFANPVSGFTNGQVVATVAGLASSGNNDAQLSSILQIPGGSTYYFKVVGTVTLTSGTGTFSGSITTRIDGDAAYPSLAALMGAAATVDGDANNDFSWSPNATTTSAAGHVDWTNGYFVSGLPSGGTDTVTIYK